MAIGEEVGETGGGGGGGAVEEEEAEGGTEVGGVSGGTEVALGGRAVER